MNTNDLLLRWSNLSFAQIEEELQSGKDTADATRLLGWEEMAEAQAIASAPPAVRGREPVVLLPGIMGSMLSSIRGVTSLVWINPLLFVKGDARYLSMDDAGKEDGCREVEIVPIGVEKLTYLKIGLTLNRETELYEFPYDWRRPIAHAADVLHERLERWAGGTDRRFTLVAHSMGGLVSRAYLARHPRAAERRVRKVVMLGTPNFGATNAVENLINGNDLMATVNKLNASNSMREVVRSLPGVYNLLPAPADVFPSGRDYPADWNLYDAAAWHTPGIRQSHLNSTRRLHRLLAGSDPQVPLIEIAGCHLDTLVRVEAAFDALKQLILKPNRVKQGENSGDGTVPLWSALLPGAEVYYIQEKHVALPANRSVIDAALRLIRDETPDLPTKLPEPKSFLGGFPFADGAAPDTGRGVVDQVEPAPLLEEKIRSGTATREDLQNLYFAF